MTTTFAKPIAEDVSLLETTFSGSPHKVDREAGVIHGVKILGRESKNGRTYSTKALHTAARMYEGIEVNIDHPDRSNPGRERGLRESFGELRGVVPRDDGVYGDLHYVKSHNMAEQVCERAERFPDKVGLSHNAQGHVIRKGSTEVVEDIDRVRSVDVVTRPATNKSLFESEDTEMAKTTIRELIESHPRGKSVLQEMEADVAAMADAPVEAPAEESSADEKAAAAFEAMIVGVVRDSSLDLSAKKKKIGEILTMEDKLMNKADPEPTPSEEDTPEETPESLDEVKKLRAEIAEMRAETAARELLESKGIEVTSARVKALAKMDSDDERKALLESWPKGRSSRRPDRSPGIDLQESEDALQFESSEELIDYLRG